MFAVALHWSEGEADHSLSVMEAVLFLMLYKQLCRPSKHSNPSTSASDRTRRASLFHKYCSVPSSYTFRMIHSVRTQSLVQHGCLEKQSLELLLLLCELPGGAGHVAVADHVVSRSETLVDELTVPSPRTMACLSCPQLWVSSCWWLLLNSQSCCQSQSELSTAAPERAEPGCKHSVWLTFTQQEWETCRTGLCASLTAWKLETRPTSQSRN